MQCCYHPPVYEPKKLKLSADLIKDYKITDMDLLNLQCYLEYPLELEPRGIKRSYNTDHHILNLYNSHSGQISLGALLPGTALRTDVRNEFLGLRKFKQLHVSFDRTPNCLVFELNPKGYFELYHEDGVVVYGGEKFTCRNGRDNILMVDYERFEEFLQNRQLEGRWWER